MPGAGTQDLSQSANGPSTGRNASEPARLNMVFATASALAFRPDGTDAASGVKQVPTLLPSIMASAASRGSAPWFTRLTSITVTRLLLCTVAVTAAPPTNPANVLALARLNSLPTLCDPNATSELSAITSSPSTVPENAKSARPVMACRNGPSYLACRSLPPPRRCAATSTTSPR